MSNIPRVFILEPCQLDTSRTARFGQQVYLFGRDEKRSSIWDNAFKAEIAAALDKYRYDPKVDYFVVVGHMVPVVIATSVLTARFGTVKVLFYSSTDRDYVPKTIGDYIP